MTLTRSMARFTAGLAGAALLSASLSAQARELGFHRFVRTLSHGGKRQRSGPNWWKNAAGVS